jgi:hypothetical protein
VARTALTRPPSPGRFAPIRLKSQTKTTLPHDVAQSAATTVTSMTTVGDPASTRFRRGMTAGSRTHAWLAAAGLTVGAAGIGLQAVAGADLPGPVPPGVVILSVAAVLTVAVRSPWMPVGSALLAVFALLNVLGHRGSVRWSAVRGSESRPASGCCSREPGPPSSRTCWLRATGRRRAVRGRAGRTASLGTAPIREEVWPRRLQIAGLLVLAPVCAEYLSAYDDSTGSPLALLGVPHRDGDDLPARITPLRRSRIAVQCRRCGAARSWALAREAVHVGPSHRVRNRC